MSTSWTKIWSSLSLDKATVLQMLKGSLPPVIVISMYQATSIANIEFTVGYLAVILTVSAQCLMPRAKFMKIVSFSVLSTCGGAALSCLVILCSVRARQHTLPANASQSMRERYNGSASAVSAIWLFFSIWLANAMRALRPIELQDPMVALSIFSGVTMTHTPSFITVSEGLGFVRRLLETFLIGLAVAAGVSLLILPMTSRRNVFKALNTYTGALDAFFTAQIAFVREEKGRRIVKDNAKLNQNIDTLLSQSDSEKEVVASTLAGLRNLQSEFNANLAYTKLEIAWGKLLPEDLICIYDHLSFLFLPLAGLGMFPEISRELLDHLYTIPTSDTIENFEDQNSEEPAQESSLTALLNGLEKRLASTCELTIKGVKVAFQLLEISASHSSTFKMNRKSTDIEKQDNGLPKDSAKSSEIFHKEFIRYKDRRRNLHKIWPSLLFPSTEEIPTIVGREEVSRSHEVTEHHLVFLFMEHVQNEILQAVHGLLEFAEKKASSGSMRRNKLIFPSLPQFNVTKFMELMSRKTAGLNASISWNTRPLMAVGAEYLPPANFLERIGDQLRIIPSILTSPESVFGFRVALASVTVAILAYLRQTQVFFNAQRLIWAMIVIVIGMKPESGASIFGYFARIAGTIVAVVLSLIVWYIVNGNTAGVLIFLYMANVFEYYFWVRYPRHLGPCTISIVTLNIIVAYELQAKKLGIERVTSNGQPYYPVYLFGPYKLLCVLAGVTISFFWTIFPYPASARSQVRKLLGRCLFLLANFYSCMHSSVKVWINEQQGDMNDSSSHGRKIQTLNRALFSKQMALLAHTQSLIQWTAYESAIGSKFPKKIYLSALTNIQVLATCMALISHTTQDIDLSLPGSDLEDSESKPAGLEEKWVRQLARATNSSEFDSHMTTSLLCHLAGAISSSSALPPYLAPPEHFPLARKLRNINTHAMHIENIQDPTFSAFACMEVATSLVNSRLKHLVKDMKDLVGEINFDLYFQDEEMKRD
ncbi:MAG: hypothetical protein Q9167_003504 [Letrouitia subvulpina]